MNWNVVMAHKSDFEISIYSSKWNKRKSICYWVGFLEGIQSSGSVEKKEIPALYAEAEAFLNLFPDADADDLLQDFQANCHIDDNDLFEQISCIIDQKIEEIAAFEDEKEKDILNRFLGFCSGIICDGTITSLEAQTLFSCFSRQPTLNRHTLFNTLKSSFSEILNKSHFETSELQEIYEWLSQLVGDGYWDTGIPNIGRSSPLSSMIYDPSAISLNGKIIVLTGPMRLGTRQYITEKLENLGATVGGRVTQKTNFVVISRNASQNRKTTHFGTKIEKAILLRSSGVSIDFMSETALEKLLT